MATPFTLRALNRATLARQMLLRREKATAVDVVGRLVAMQAQVARPPYVGIWSRANGFSRETLTRSLLDKKIVRATSLRGTLHLMTAKDFVGLRAAMQPALSHGMRTILGARANGFDVDRLLARARPFFADGPRSFEAFRDELARRDPAKDIRALAYIVRTHLPLVQVPEAGETWGYATRSDFVLAEKWIGKAIAADAGSETLVTRYLAAFGPGTAADVQTWSGLPAPLVKDAFVALRPKLTVLPGERGRELFDLPKAPRPPEDTAAPPRFLPEFDNLLLSHAQRRRFLADAHRHHVYLPGLRVAPTFLVDGFVAGTWRVEQQKNIVTLTVESFGTLAKETRAALAEEGEGLGHFLEPDAARTDVKFVKKS